MKFLLAGAGAVGQVYGHFLQKGGAEVAFLVKPKHADDCRRGFTLYALNKDRSRPLKMSGFGVLTRPEEAAKEKWDAVFLCIPSTGLEDGWFRELAKSIGDATMVSLLPGIDDRDFIVERFPKERLVTGLISLVSYIGPLPGEMFPEPGTAFWFPPLSPSPFSGPPARTAAIVRAMKSGGFPCITIPDTSKASAVPGAVLMAFVLSLEASSWSLRRLRSNGGLELTGSAALETIGVSYRKMDAPEPPFLRFVIRPWLLRTVLGLAPRVVPFDLETYLRIHFTKVGPQMHQGLDKFIAHADKLGLPAESLKELRRRLGG